MELETKEKILSTVFDKYEASISSSTIHKLALRADEVYFPRGSMVLGINQTQAFVYLLANGIARSYVTDEQGNEIVRNFMLEKDFLLGESLFSNTSLESFDAIEDLNCLRFKAEDLKQFIMEDNQLKDFYIKMLESTLRYKMQREYSFQNLSAKERYKVFKDTFGQAEKRIPLNQIASYIGIKKESLSRLRRNFKSN